MFTLRLLGGLRLENEQQDPTGRATQRLRLAALAVLALTPDRRITRDRLIAILWPEATSEEGRRRLSNALYDMRRLLGERAVGARGDLLWLDPGCVAVDVEQFLAAVKREAWEEAAELYRGPLLDGVHLPDSAAFEEWLAGHRERLHRAWLNVIERAGARRAGAGDWSGAATEWSRLVSAEPLSGRWTLELMRALAALGERAGAIRAGERFQAQLRKEMGLEPDPAIAAFAADLRRSALPSTSGPGPALMSADQTAAPGGYRLRPQPSSSGSEPGAPAPPLRRHPRLLVLAAAAIGSVGIAGLLLARLPGSHPAPTALPLSIAVLPFTVTGDSSLRFLQDGLVDLLSANLEGVGSFAAVDPHALLAEVRRPGPSRRAVEVALRLGAQRFLVGTVYGWGDSLRIQAALREVPGGRLIREVKAEGRPDAVPSMVDRLTAQLAAGESGDGGNRIASVAALTTLSIPALREFLAGEAHFRQGRFGRAVSAYRQAVALDTTFALAHYRLSLAMLWGNEPAANTEFHDSLALHHASRLSPRDRSLVEAYVAWRGGRGDEALRRYDQLARQYPDDVEAWYQRGETQFHYGPQLGQPIAEARVSFERVVALDPSHWGARWHLALLDAKEGRRARLEGRVAELLALGPDSNSAAEMQLVAGPLLHGAPPLRLNDQILFGAAWRKAVYLGDLEGARVLLRALADPGRSLYSRQLGHVGLGELEAAQGRWLQAVAYWDSTSGWATFDLPVFSALLPGFERPAEDRDLAERRLRAWSESVSGTVATVPDLNAAVARCLGLLAAARGDTADALRLARHLDTLSVPAPNRAAVRAMAMTIRAFVAYGQQRLTDALTFLEQGRHTTWPGDAVSTAGKAELFERFLRAEILRRLKRPVEALGWYGTFDEHAVHDLMFLGPALLRSAELNQATGRPELAAEQLGRAAMLWRQADPASRRLLARHVTPQHASRGQ